MNFFERQDQARRKTSYLVFLFVVAVILIFLAIHSVVALMVGASLQQGTTGTGAVNPQNVNFSLMAVWLDPRLLLIDFLAVALVIGCGSLGKITQLASLEGEGIARSLGGDLIPLDTTDFQEKRILNIVEEMAVASGIHVPPVYLLREEEQINAFAAGFSANTAVIGITQGALDYLSRDELQGVIGHEFSHILNGDTNINLRLIGILFGLEMLVILGVFLFRNSIYVMYAGGNSRDKNGGAAGIGLAMMALGGALCIIGLFGLFFSNIIKAAISRQREFLADASAVQFTRNPDGIAGALKKIGCPAVGSSIDDPHSVEASHLFFGNVFKPGFFSSLFNTHPDLTTRIKAIDPNFTGSYPNRIEKVGLVLHSQQEESGASKAKLQELFNRVLPVGGAGGGIPGTTIPGASVITGSILADSSVSPTSPTPSMPIAEMMASGPLPDATISPSLRMKMPTDKAIPAQIAEELVDSVGEIKNEHLLVATALLATIPPPLLTAVRTQLSAKAVIYALLASDDINVRQRQLAYLAGKESPQLIAMLQSALGLIAGQPIGIKVPVMELCYPALRRLMKREYTEFRQNVIELIKADNRVDIFEFTLQNFLLRDLDDRFGIRTKPDAIYDNVSAVRKPLITAMSFLAWQGNDNDEAATAAFNAGMEIFSIYTNAIPRPESTPLALSQSLEELIKAAPLLKKELLKAFYRCIVDDGIITETEGALIRAIAAALDCPMPAWTGAV